MNDLVEKWACYRIRPILIMVFFALYTYGFTTTAWLTADNREWTLWRWCYTNVTDQGQDKDEESRCHNNDISLTPNYFKAVEVFACLGMIGHCLLILAFIDKKQHLPHRQRNLVYLQLATALMILISIAMFAHCYKSDVRWENLNSDIAAGFIVACVSCGLSFITACIHWKVLDIVAKRKAAGNNTVRPKRHNTTTNAQQQQQQQQHQQQQQNGAGEEGISSQRQTLTHDRGNDTNISASSHGSESSRSSAWSMNSSFGLYAIPGNANDENERTSRWPSLSTRESNLGGSQFPVLSLPPYEQLYPNPRLSGPFPAEPPPSYEISMQNSTQIR